jgi:hypothetical protein
MVSKGSRRIDSPTAGERKTEKLPKIVLDYNLRDIYNEIKIGLL